MESGDIKDNQITLYNKDGNKESDKYKDRLNNGEDYWDAGSGETAAEFGFIQVDLLKEIFVAEVVTQVKDGYRTRFSVSNSNNGYFQPIITENVRKLLISRNACKLFSVCEFVNQEKVS